VPHLFKGTRNNLLSKNLHFKQNGQKKVAHRKTVTLRFDGSHQTMPKVNRCSYIFEQNESETDDPGVQPYRWWIDEASLQMGLVFFLLY
jgi:hypothetical protein